MAEDQTSLSSLSLDFVEELYDKFLKNPENVSEGWRKYFSQLSQGQSGFRRQPSFETFSIFNPPGGNGAKTNGGNGSSSLHDRQMRDVEIAYLQDRIDQLIRSYRIRGHMIANLDPLGTTRPQQPELDPTWHGLTEQDLDKQVSTRSVSGSDRLTIRELLTRLRNTYCRSIGVQFMHIDDYAPKTWLQERMEATENRLALSKEEQLRILTRLTDAVMFEEFIQKKFMGSKSFSLEGAESLIPLLELAIERSSEAGVKEIVIGMAHRGRLNVLANIMQKSPREIFREFEDKDPDLHAGGGDVKYHLGYHCDWTTSQGQEIHLALCFNPSHLEFVNPVALGRVRAKQDRLGDTNGDRYLALLIHGDAAFAGEGITQETLNLSELEGYATGGTIHVIVNNQIGFTTSPREGRSGVYATDIARMLQAPIFHVNGEDPEAVAQVVQLAVAFRMRWKRDVFIDMYCYRRRGHNEGDEPSFTQPIMYRKIEKKPSIRDAYLDRLQEMGQVTREEADEIASRCRSKLEKELSIVRSEDKDLKPTRPSILGRVWKSYMGGLEIGVPEVDTGVGERRLSRLLENLAKTPDGFNVHPKLQRFLDTRLEMARGERPLDWSAGETLAYATLVTEGARVRLSGQDSERGTFSHRHSVLHDWETGARYTPLKNVSKDQAPFEVYNSPLSEAGVLGFEYGYSIAYPDGLVIWEAQFGDFWNAAQVIVDQFIASAEDKWRSLSGLVLLLPHGFEGMGPEHSSARLERFLLMGAEDNIQVVNPTTPAQFFHVLRRQVLRSWRKPLVVMTPKSLLRHPQVVSPLQDFSSGIFQRVLPDLTLPADAKVNRVLLCSGKLYYELLAARQEQGFEDMAILRLEQLYPLPLQQLKDALSPYPDHIPVTWVQEEPANMGAWRYLKYNIGDTLLQTHSFQGVARPDSASPATGSASAHRAEQQELFARAFNSQKP